MFLGIKMLKKLLQKSPDNNNYFISDEGAKSLVLTAKQKAKLKKERKTLLKKKWVKGEIKCN